MRAISNHRLLIAVGAAWMLAAVGCAPVGNYFGNRAADLADMFTLEMTAGPGADVHGQFTGFLGTAAGWSGQQGLLLHGRYYGIGERETAGFILLGATAAASRNMSSLYGDGPAPERYGLWGLFLPVFISPNPALHVGYLPPWPRAADVELGASLGVGLHAGFSPGELLDFLVGFTTLDIAGDDKPLTPPRRGEEATFPPMLILPRGLWHPWFFPPELGR